jgi:hypothetical protein
MIFLRKSGRCFFSFFFTMLVAFLIYVTAHSRLGASTPEYVKDGLAAGRKYADGVFIYCNPDPVKSPEKYKIIKNGFR